MREQDKLVVLSGLAFSWHVGDAIIHRNSKSKVHKTFMGIGIGWSAFWVALNLLARAKTQYQEAHYTPPMV